MPPDGNSPSRCPRCLFAWRDLLGDLCGFSLRSLRLKAFHRRVRRGIADIVENCWLSTLPLFTFHSFPVHCPPVAWVGVPNGEATRRGSMTLAGEISLPRDFYTNFLML